MRRAYVNIGFATDRKILVFEHLKQFPTYLNRWDSQQARNESLCALILLLWGLGCRRPILVNPSTRRSLSGSRGPALVGEPGRIVPS